MVCIGSTAPSIVVLHGVATHKSDLQAKSKYDGSTFAFLHDADPGKRASTIELNSAWFDKEIVDALHTTPLGKHSRTHHARPQLTPHTPKKKAQAGHVSCQRHSTCSSLTATSAWPSRGPCYATLPPRKASPLCASPYGTGSAQWESPQMQTCASMSSSLSMATAAFDTHIKRCNKRSYP